MEQGGQIQRNDPAADGADHADRKLADAGQQGGNGRTGHPQRGKAAVAENQQVVQPGVHQCGKAEQLHAEGGVLHAALGAGIDGREHIEHIGKTDDSQIRRTQQGQLVTVGQQIHHLHGEQEKHHCQHNGNARADEGGHTDGAVDAAGIPFAPVLADQNPQPALHAEYDADEQKDRDVGSGDCCHLLIAQLTDHKGVDQSQRKGDEVLQNDRQGQRPQPLVKAGIPAGKGRHDKSLRCMLIWNRH